MLVYGDVEFMEYTEEIRSSIARDLDAYVHQAAGRERHSTLVTAFIRASELLQGLADAEFKARGADDISAVQEDGARLLLGLAQVIVRSWNDNFAGDLPLPADWTILLDRLSSPLPVRTRRAEGYAFYALYPESYIEAAARSGLRANTVVIGIRSIGTGLGALVAAAIGAGPAITVRPTGHPYQRHIEIAPALAEKILADADADFAIVDEGPGLSGSSFGGVADWLQAQGVALERLHFFPAHAGELGPKASLRHRERWAGRPRHIVEFDNLTIRTTNPAHRLATWVSELVGPLDAPMSDVSGGAWRTRRYADEKYWPPSHTHSERRKFLAQAGGETWLVKSVGLGNAGMCKLQKGRTLAEAGYSPKVIGICHGFLVQQWVDGVPLDTMCPDRSRLIEAIGQYLGFRAHSLPAMNQGASLPELFAMAIFNIGQASGDEAAARVKTMLGEAARFDSTLRPVDTDNRLHSWEWLIAPDGHFIKIDALDHSSAHDLIGCQDIAWDVAGASVEFDLSPQERAQLASMVSPAAVQAENAELLEAFELCYIGFQLGLWTFTLASSAGAEAIRVKAALTRYSDRLQVLLRMRD
jgi:hypothetical protein